MNTEVMFSSNKEDWETPQWLFDKYNAMYGFTTDVCATKENAKCANFYTPEMDGLNIAWEGRCWCIPPYGRTKTGKWVAKAVEEVLWGCPLVVMLLPARTDTKWFHEYVLPYGEIEFLKGRVRFVGAKDTAPFPSMIVVFRRK